MKECSKCKIKTNTSKRQCPLCFNELDGEFEGDKGTIIYNTDKHKDNTISNNYILTRIFLFLTFAISSICLFINFTADPTVWWSPIVILSLVYVWILVRHTILSQRGAFEKVLFQFIGILAVVFSSNFVAGGQDWIWFYLIPSGAIATSTVLAMILLINKKRSDFVVSAFAMALLVIGISLTLVLTRVDTFKLLNFINILYSGLFALAILVFGGRSLKRGLQKNFHL